VVRAADTVIAIGGAYGTLSEVALALKTGVPVIGLHTWAIDGIEVVDTPDGALEAIQQRT
jgi:predicted Rossmann-fold nucleotide-binding protein